MKVFRVVKSVDSVAIARTCIALGSLCLAVSYGHADEISAFRAQLSGAASGFQVDHDDATQGVLEESTPGTTDTIDIEQILKLDADGYALSGKAITELTLFRAPSGREIRIQASASGTQWRSEDLEFSVTGKAVTRTNGVVTDTDSVAVSGQVDADKVLSLTGLLGAYVLDPNVGFLGGFVAAGRNEDANARTFGAAGGLFTSIFNMPVNVRLDGGWGDGEQDLESWYVAASAEAFMTPEWAVLLDVGYGDAEITQVDMFSSIEAGTLRFIDTIRADVLRIGLESRWQIEQSPASLSLFGNYVRTDGRQRKSVRTVSPGLLLANVSLDFGRTVDVDYLEGGVRLTLALGATKQSSLSVFKVFWTVEVVNQESLCSI